MDEWKIVRDREKCTRPGCTLPTDSEYFAVLELPSCTRRDVCAACFREVREQDGEPAFWKVHRRETDKAPTYDLQSLRQLFDRLGQEDAQSENAAGLRYLIALLLLRKRVLKMVDPATPEQERADLVVVDPKIEAMEPIALSGPEMTDERLEQLKAELLEALGT